MGLKYKENTTANYYVYMLESGNDSNSGLTPALAVKTVNRAIEILETYTGTKRRYCVSDRRKIYNESSTYLRTAGRSITWEFLNNCIIDGSGASAVKIIIGGDILMNCIITGYDSATFFDFPQSTWAPTKFYNCKFINNSYTDLLTINDTGTYRNLTISYNCVFKNTYLPANRTDRDAAHVFYNCVIDGCIVGKGATGSKYFFNNCIIVNGVTTQSGGIADYRFVNCDIVTTYLTKNLSTIQAEGKAIDCISTDPFFNDVTNLIYSVNSSSPCLYAGINNLHIGLGEGLYINAEDLLGDAIDSDNLEFIGSKLIRTDVDQDAYLESKVYHNGTNRIVNLIQLAATLGYLAEQVVQSVQLDPADALNPYPCFLTFKLKIGETETACNASSWICFPFNQMPLKDEAGVGNGSEDFDETDVLSNIKINYWKIYIFITNLS